MTVSEALKDLRAHCDSWFKLRGFRFDRGRRAYGRRTDIGAEYVYLRLLSIGGDIRLDLSAAEGEPEPPATELLAEDMIPLLQVVDHRELAPVDPAGERHQQELQRRRAHGELPCRAEEGRPGHIAARTTVQGLKITGRSRRSNSGTRRERADEVERGEQAGRRGPGRAVAGETEEH